MWNNEITLLFIAFASSKSDAQRMKQNRLAENAQQFPPPGAAASQPVLVLSSVDKATKNELEAILRKPATTAEEK